MRGSVKATSTGFQSWSGLWSWINEHIIEWYTHPIIYYFKYNLYEYFYLMSVIKYIYISSYIPTE